MLTRLVIRDNTVVEAPGDAADVLAFVGSDEPEKRQIAEVFRLDDYDLASAFDPDEVARLEVVADGIFILWTAPQRVQIAEAIELGVRPMAFVLGPDRLGIVVGAGDLPFTAREFRRVEDVRDVLLGYLLHTVRHYVGHLRAIKQLSADLEAKITASLENRHLLQMFALGESLVYYLDALEGNGAVLAKLRGLSGQLGFSLRQQQLLDDIILENQQAARQANIYSSVLSGLMDARASIVNNNMNVLLKNLALINSVFLPLNLIAGIGGMSEWTMMTQGMDWRLSYALFITGTGLLGWLIWFLLTSLVEPGGGSIRRKGRFKRRAGRSPA